MGIAKTEFEKLFAVYDDLTTAIADIHDPVVLSLCSSWKSSKSAYEQALMRISAIVTGHFGAS
jgi:hypothetical protein